MDARILVPVRYAAWLSGELGTSIANDLQAGLGHVPGAKVQRLPRGLLVEADESPGPLLEAVGHAVHDLEDAVKKRYPVFHQEMGPVWTGTLQAVFA